jgi:hypothetical protein
MTRSAKGSVAAPGRNVAAKEAGLNRALLDASFGRLAALIREKAESARSQSGQRGSQVFVARVPAVRAHCGRESLEKARSVRSVRALPAR